MKRALRMAPLVMMTRCALTAEDPYEVLGLSRSANADEIRRAYKKKAAKAHPDRGGDPDEFKKIAKAYAILSDDDKKRSYDSGGKQFGEQPFPEGDMFDAFKLFEQFFSGGGDEPRFRIRPRIVRLRLSLEDLFHGGNHDIGVPRTVACPQCNGKGGEFIICSTCNGAGASIRDERFGNFIRRIRTPCPTCRGSGEILTSRCPRCRGDGRLQEQHRVRVSVPPGAEDGDRFDFPSQGDVVFHTSARGIIGQEDIIVIIEEKDHPELQRLGPDLLAAKRISLIDALTRVRIDVPDLATKGRRFKVTLTSLPVAPDDVFQIKNAGMPSSRGRGNLYVRFIVEFPTSLPHLQGDLDRRSLLATALGGLKDDASSDGGGGGGGAETKSSWSFEDLFAGVGRRGGGATTKQSSSSEESRVASRAPKADVDRLIDMHSSKRKSRPPPR